MSAYDGPIAMAKRLIAAKGQTLDFRRAGETAYDPASDTTIGPVESQFDAVAVVLPASQSTAEMFDARFPGPVLAASNMRLLLVAADGLAETPTAGDRVVGVEGDDWTVVGSVPLAPDGTPIIHTVTLKR
ncbi:MAG: hypothetical protein AAF414_13295 [Pseudomonadota bacterium]